MGACQAGTKTLHRQHNLGGINQTGSTQSSQTCPPQPSPATFTGLEVFSTKSSNDGHYGFGDLACFITEHFGFLSKGKFQLRKQPSQNQLSCVPAW